MAEELERTYVIPLRKVKTLKELLELLELSEKFKTF